MSNATTPQGGECLILGLGNDILRDDQVGLAVVRNLGPLPDGYAVREAAIGGMALVEVFVGFKRGLIVDADMTTERPAGNIRHINLDEVEHPPALRSAHDADLPSSLELARRLGWVVPDRIDVVAIDVRDAITFDEQMTPEVTAAVPLAVAKVREVLGLEPLAGD